MKNRQQQLSDQAIQKSYMNFQRPKENRGNVILFIVLFLDFFGLISLVGEPFSLPFFLVGAIPLLVMNVWSIVYIMNPYKYEHSYYLFIYGHIRDCHDICLLCRHPKDALYKFSSGGSISVSGRRCVIHHPFGRDELAQYQGSLLWYLCSITA